MKNYLALVICLVLAGTLLAQENNPVPADKGSKQQIPAARKIPGLTIEDKYPNACVDCHVKAPDINQDGRISTKMARWNKNVEPELLKKAQAAARAGATLTGVHPPASAALKNIPTACITCHTSKPKIAPPFASMIHVIHLTGGDENHFMTIFQGECTNCHKLNTTTGVWSVPSGPEK